MKIDDLLCNGVYVYIYSCMLRQLLLGKKRRKKQKRLSSSRNRIIAIINLRDSVQISCSLASRDSQARKTKSSLSPSLSQTKRFYPLDFLPGSDVSFLQYTHPPQLCSLIDDPSCIIPPSPSLHPPIFYPSNPPLRALPAP